MSIRSRCVRRGCALHTDQRGQTLVEYALTALLVLVVVFGSIEFCSLVYTYTTLADAANEGLRYFIVHSTDQSGATAKVRAFAALSLHDTSALGVAIACPDRSCAPGNRATITVTYSYLPYLSTFMPSPPTLTAFAEGRTVY